MYTATLQKAAGLGCGQAGQGKGRAGQAGEGHERQTGEGRQPWFQKMPGVLPTGSRVEAAVGPQPELGSTGTRWSSVSALK